ncbi:MAG: enoyl-CoA hydratase/isomerase family protein [Desulfobacula sp.]|nr:enoyl-CoA hydratase/isomerase family protein [Desulfobacula sp.]
MAIEYVSTNGTGLVIGNEAKGKPAAFSAGADLFHISKLCRERGYTGIDALLKNAQQGIRAIKFSPVPIIAAPYGLTLGGGCEICLSADKIIAHTSLHMGLVESRVGLLPSGGGCANLWAKHLDRSASEMNTDVGLAKLFLAVFKEISMARVSSSADQAKNKGFLTKKDSIISNRDHLIEKAKKTILKIEDGIYTAPIDLPLKVLGIKGQNVADEFISKMLEEKLMTDYDAFLSKRIAYVISGGNIEDGSKVTSENIMNLERDAFVDFCREKRTIARIDHMLKTGKPLRN